MLTTASYEARKYGVRSGMPGRVMLRRPFCTTIIHENLGFIAKKLCPELILVGINFQRYSEMSNRVMDIFRQYDPNMSVVGCDEGYLKYVQNYGPFLILPKRRRPASASLPIAASIVFLPKTVWLK